MPRVIARSRLGDIPRIPGDVLCRLVHNSTAAIDFDFAERTATVPLEHEYLANLVAWLRRNRDRRFAVMVLIDVPDGVPAVRTMLKDARFATALCEIDAGGAQIIIGV